MTAKKPALPIPEPLFPNAPKLREGFREANPAAFGRANGDPETIRRLGIVEARASNLAEKLRAHVARHEPAWIAKESKRLLQKNSVPTLRLAPQNRGWSPPPAADVTRQARQIVHARITGRMTKLNETKRRLENAIVRSAPKQESSPPPALKPAFRKALNRNGP